MKGPIIRIAPKLAAARLVRHELKREIGGHTREHGDNLAGFALVSWDGRGGCISTVHSGGIVSESLVPTLVHDALNRHIAVNMTKRALASDTDA